MRPTPQAASIGTDEILHAAEIDSLEQRVLELALERTDSKRGSLFLWNPRTSELRVELHLSDGVRVALPDAVFKRRLDGRPNGIAFWVADRNEPYLCNDTTTDPQYGRYFQPAKSVAAAPIVYQSIPIGVLSVASPETNAFTPAHMAELEALAASSAKFLRRAALYRSKHWGQRRPLLIKGLSPEWLEVERTIERVSATDAPVLIRGESGTGKELVAHAIHFNSRRMEKPFITVNCAAIPESLLESALFGHVRGAFTGASYAKVGEFQKASGGTLFLDEVGELTPPLQAKILRAIDQGEVQPLGSNEPPKRCDVRVLGATNRDLERMRREGLFRDDLYFRLAVVTVSLPPLRSFMNNLLVLCDVYMDQANRQFGRSVREISPDALAALHSYDFPGNLRELKNVIDHAVLMASGETIEGRDLTLPLSRPARLPPGTGAEDQTAGAPAAGPDKGAHPPPGDEASGEQGAGLTLSAARESVLQEGERRYLTDLMRRCEGDVKAAAGIAGVDITTLYRLMKKRGVSPKGRGWWHSS
ncbi:MAG: sigma-54-dependent Fis family transcriptional regulator [Planctomycetes bacterium]|nr:sigma-54-dependent Fis family transcriptional regulator [Planctomycetota bacterium]